MSAFSASAIKTIGKAFQKPYFDLKLPPGALTIKEDAGLYIYGRRTSFISLDESASEKSALMLYSIYAFHPKTERPLATLSFDRATIKLLIDMAAASKKGEFLVIRDFANWLSSGWCLGGFLQEGGMSAEMAGIRAYEDSALVFKL